MYRLLFVLLPVFLFAQENSTVLDGGSTIQYRFFDSNALDYFDGRGVVNQTTNQTNTNLQRKYPLLAGSMSLVLPGTGEIYSGNYLRGAAHLAVEAAGWVVYFIYQGKGDDKTAFFQNFANEHWSVVRYTEWLNAYWLNGWDPVPIDPDDSKPPWERVNWADLHKLERRISEFSHTLEPYGTQQYYELIGKYTQYNHGWSDAQLDPNNPRRYYDNPSPYFLYYSGLRGRANTYYARSHNAIMALFVNHILSAFHAAFLAHRYNELHFSVDIQTRETLYGTRTVPMVYMSLGF